MIIAVVFVGMVCGIASGGTLRLAFECGWIAVICGFYAGVFLGVAVTALRIAAMRDARDGETTARQAPDPGIARAG